MRAHALGPITSDPPGFTALEPWLGVTAENVSTDAEMATKAASKSDAPRRARRVLSPSMSPMLLSAGAGRGGLPEHKRET
mmetsp:Transcript_79288/g.184021  ORF Transcript_79288/g.184021 Transcript_79288/m.184021 type:complete len:80 (+) Transcript_79288:413-652(+)